MNHLQHFEDFISGDYAFDGFLIEGKGIPNTVKNVANRIVNGKTMFTIDYIDLKVNDFIVDLNFSNTKYNQANIRINNMNGNIIDKATLKLDIKIDDLGSSEIKRLLTHEVLHLYEIYQRTQKNNYKVGLEWHVSDILQRIKSKYAIKSQAIYDFTMVLYLAFEHEINARVAETYSVLIETRNDDKKYLYEILRRSNAWNCAEKIENYKPVLLPTDYPIFKDLFNELNSNINNTKDFIVYKTVVTDSDVDDILKQYTKYFDKKARNFKRKMIKVITEVIDDINRIEEQYKW
jgi:hypothetical protein